MAPLSRGVMSVFCNVIKPQGLEPFQFSTKISSPSGPYALAVTAGVNARLPYGNLPRLLLAWVCTEAVRTQSRELVLGRSLYEFMHKLGLTDRSSGANGERTRLRNQMRRLFSCSVSLVYADAQHEVRVHSFVADRAEFWWDVKRPAAPVLWNSTIQLGEQFFNEIIAHPIPLDLNILKSLKRSPLGLDLYLWLTLPDVVGLKRPLRLTWPQLYRQFGPDPSRAGETRTVDYFRTKCLRELKKIKTALAGPWLWDCQGGARPLAVQAAYFAGTTAPRGLAGRGPSGRRKGRSCRHRPGTSHGELQRSGGRHSR